jgi:hypothetical protein
MFEGRHLIIATKHQKEKIIAPIMEKAFGVNALLAKDMDTDSFGTFSGEIKRLDDALSTARKKCNRALAISGQDLAIASEGSFGVHPSLFFTIANEEIIVLVDKKNKCEFYERVISFQTNSDASFINSIDALKQFAKKALFPSHGLILRKSKDDYSQIEYVISSWKKLYRVYNSFKSDHETVWVETDMRANKNPTRNEVILQVTTKLIQRLQNKCPKCDFPGFGLTKSVAGLICQSCCKPTNSILYHQHTCSKCAHEVAFYYPNNKKTENPMYCDYCNP